MIDMTIEKKKKNNVSGSYQSLFSAVGDIKYNGIEVRCCKSISSKTPSCCAHHSTKENL